MKNDNKKNEEVKILKTTEIAKTVFKKKQKIFSKNNKIENRSSQTQHLGNCKLMMEKKKKQKNYSNSKKGKRK